MYGVNTLDKYEYKVRADEIKSLISEGEYAQAAKIADSIDWRRVKSVMMLCTVSDLYKINRRYEDSRDILLLAYERHTGGRLIVYSLCELSIKLGEYVQALEYYKEFVQLAPKDSGRYVLQYKLYEAQEVSLEERIEVLEELKKRDYREKWAYELAYLYHRVGLASKCVEECDEMFLWFGEGRHVLKALELKMLHEPLSADQQIKYEQMKQTGGFITPDYVADQQAIREKVETQAEEEDEEDEEDEFSLEENILTENTQEIPVKEEMDIQVKTVDVSQYNTINLQKELAESMKEFLEENRTRDLPPVPAAPVQETPNLMQTQIYEPVKGLDSRSNTGEKVQPWDRNINLNKETGEIQIITENELEEIVEEDYAEQPVLNEEKESNGSEEIFFGNTEEVNIQDVVSELNKKNDLKTPFSPINEQVQMPEGLLIEEEPVKKSDSSFAAASPNPAISNTGIIRTFHKPSGYDNLLSQEYDGQISLVIPEQEKLEKQITGQLSIEDIMAEWEKMKQDSERKRMDEIRKRVHQQTDTLFADFDEATKTGLLEELEKAMVTAAIREEKQKAAKERPKIVKMATLHQKAEEEKEEEKTSLRLSEEELPIAEDKEEALEIMEIQEIEEETEFTEEVPQKQEDTETEESESSKIEEVKEEIKKVPKKKVKKKAEQKSQDKEQAVKTDLDVQEEKTLKEDNSAKVSSKKQKDTEAEEDGENKYSSREMSNGEREQFAPFIHHKRTRKQIVEAIDNISLASYTGNVIITGEEGTGTTDLAKRLVKEVQLSDSNFSGKMAKISGATMNKKDIGATLSRLSGGALIIEAATSMKNATVEQLLKELNQEERGLIILLEDTKPKINDFLTKHPDLEKTFNLRVDVEALDDQTLVKYAKKYALEQEYSIDELGILALHTRIADMQTSDHEVTLAEIEELIDEAIYYADKKTPKHFFDVLLGKRYDQEDMIVLRENDFMHY